METEDHLKIQRAVEEKNAEIKRYNRNNSITSTFEIKLDTAFGINSTPISNQLQMVG